MEKLYPIKGYEGIYSITKSGKVWSHPRERSSKNGMWIKQRILNGYWSFNLHNMSIKNKATHILLAQQFIPNPLNKPEVNHIDGNKLNNDISNLEWVTKSEQSLHAYKLGLKKPARKFLTQEQAEEIRKLSSNGIKNSEIAKKFNVSRCVIGHIIVGNTYRE